MKNLAYILLILLSSFFGAANPTIYQKNAVANKKDTTKKYAAIADSLGYMAAIAANKEKYINQPFSVLLNDLKMPVKSFSIHHNLLTCFGIWIYFDDSYITEEQKWNNRDEDKINIIVEWAKPIVRSDIEASLHKGAGEWTMAEQNYFKNEIVSDIVVPFRKGN